MTEASANEGTLKYKRDQRRRVAVFIASLAMVGLACAGIYFAGQFERTGRTIDPALAIALTLLFAVGTVIGNWLYLKNSDELVWANHLSASFWALAALLILYPAWLILWAGGLVDEPDAKGLYIITFTAAGLVYFWKKFR
jgi:hypothetical protein